VGATNNSLGSITYSSGNNNANNPSALNFSDDGGVFFSTRNTAGRLNFTREANFSQNVFFNSTISSLTASINGTVTSTTSTATGSTLNSSSFLANGILGGFTTNSSTPSVHYRTSGSGVRTGIINTGTVGGTGTNGSYSNISFTGGTGTGFIANVTVSGGAVTVITPTNRGVNYSVGDVLSGAITGGTATFTITSVDFTGNSVYQFFDESTIVDAKSINSYNSFGGTPTINITSTQAGLLRGFYWNPTLTNLGSFGHLAIHAVSGSNVFGHTSLSSSTTRMQVRGIGTGSGKVVTFEDNTGVERLGVTDAGSISVTKATNTTAGDAATINAVAGTFRKDNSGSTFTLTNSFISSTSIVVCTLVTTGITTGYQISVQAGSGSATITFETAGVAAAPSANCDVNFIVLN
jgi:hypothetical protein